MASLSISLATSSLGAELERLPRPERPVLRPVPESSLTSGSSLSLFSWRAKYSKSSQSGEKLFSLEMVYDWNMDSPVAKLVSPLLPIGFFPVLEVLAMALRVLEAFL